MRTNYQCKLVWSLWNGILLLHRHKIHIHAFVHTPSSPMVSPFTNLHQHRDSWSTRQHSPLLSDVSSFLSFSSNMNVDDEDDEKDRTKDFGRIHPDRRWIVQSIFYGICLNNFCILNNASASEIDQCNDGIIVAGRYPKCRYLNVCLSNQCLSKTDLLLYICIYIHTFYVSRKCCSRCLSTNVYAITRTNYLSQGTVPNSF